MSFEDQARAAGYDVTAPPLRGGSGLVYRAIESATGAPVAIKALAPGFDIERLRREAEILARIDHPNVATLRAFTLIDQNPALIVDWVDGLPLSGLIKRGQPLPRQQAFAIFEQIADAMTAVHDAGVIHRDLSPANVLVDQDGVVTVIDFGVSRSMDAATVTVEGMVAGTPRYLAPEVIEGADPTVGSDQYSAAIILHELLTGSWPFPEGDAIATAFHHQLHTAPKPLDEIHTDLPSGVGDAVLQALEKDPADRFESMPAFVRGLHQPAPKPSGGRRRRTSASAIGFRVGIPLLLLAAIISSLWGNDSDPSDGAEPEALATADADADSGTGTDADSDQSDDERPTVSVSVPTDDAAPEGDQITSSSLPATTTLEPAANVRVVSGWDAGIAEALVCNLLVEADFETPELPKNYFALPDEPARDLVMVQNSGGVAGTGALQIGQPGFFGLWGEEIPVVEGQSYLFSAHAALDGPIGESELSVFWLNNGFEVLGESTKLDLTGITESQVTLDVGTAPPGATFAVPRVYKDNSEGVLNVDEMVFAQADSDCRNLLLG